MAAQKNGAFPEVLSSFLRQKYRQAQAHPRQNRDVIRVIERQYLATKQEEEVREGEISRHYEADVTASFKGQALKGVERLYRRSIVIEPTTACAAHCRWCIRASYDILHLSDQQLTTAAQFCGAPENADLREVLITGGDPFVHVGRLAYLLHALDQYAPQIVRYRIATRVPLHDPRRIDTRLLDLLSTYRDKVALALHVNRPAETFEEVRDSLLALKGTGVRMYDQTVLLKGLNDDLETLIELYDTLRAFGIEMHYLFHCVPIRGMRHYRTTVKRGLELAAALSASGVISGRAKPLFTLMTTIGKIIPYEGSILDRRGDKLLLRSHYAFQERKKYNPSWRLPPNASVDGDGLLRVWYEDEEVNCDRALMSNSPPSLGLSP